MQFDGGPAFFAVLAVTEDVEVRERPLERAAAATVFLPRSCEEQMQVGSVFWEVEMTSR